MRDTDEKASDRVASSIGILDTLPFTLPDEKQEALMDLIANTARLMQK